MSLKGREGDLCAKQGGTAEFLFALAEMQGVFVFRWGILPKGCPLKLKVRFFL